MPHSSPEKLEKIVSQWEASSRGYGAVIGCCHGNKPVLHSSRQSTDNTALLGDAGTNIFSELFNTIIFTSQKYFYLKKILEKLQQKLSPQKSLRIERVCKVARKIFVALWLKNIWRALVGSIVRAWQSRAAWLLATSPLPPWPSGITATFGPGRARHTTGVHHHQLPFYFLPADSDSKYLPAVKTSTNPRRRSLQKTHKVNVDFRLFTFCVFVCGCTFLRK